MPKSAFGVFKGGEGYAERAEQHEREKARLELNVRQLVVEVEWLKKCREMGITP